MFDRVRRASLQSQAGKAGALQFKAFAVVVSHRVALQPPQRHLHGRPHRRRAHRGGAARELHGAARPAEAADVVGGAHQRLEAGVEGGGAGVAPNLRPVAKVPVAAPRRVGADLQALCKGRTRRGESLGERSCPLSRKQPAGRLARPQLWSDSAETRGEGGCRGKRSAVFRPKQDDDRLVFGLQQNKSTRPPPTSSSTSIR